jgi:hypothetical protein
LPWSDESGPLPRRSLEDLLALTRRKAEALGERRRREVTVGVVSTVVLLVGLATMFVREGGERATEVRAASGGTPSPSSLGSATTNSPATSTTTTDVDRVLPFPPLPPTTGSGAATGTTAVPRATVPPADDPGTTTTTVAWVSCENRDYAYEFTLDKPVYQLGEVVRATMTVTNTSTRECYAFDSGFQALVIDAGGEQVGNLSAIAAGCPPSVPCGTALPPGGGHSAAWCWSQEVEPGRLVSAGSYTLEVSWMGTTRRLSFQTIGSPPSSTTTTNAFGLSYC